MAGLLVIPKYMTFCYVSTGRQPDLGGALSDCHWLSVAGVSPKVFSQYLIRDGALQHVSSEMAALQAVPTVMNKGSQRTLVELLLLGIQDIEG